MNGKVDVLINNAGVGVSKSISELSIDDFLSVFNVNVLDLHYSPRKFLNIWLMSLMEQLLILVQQPV